MCIIKNCTSAGLILNSTLITLCSDAAFGGLPWRRIDRPSWDQFRPGDVVEYKNEKSYHAVVVIRKNAEYIVVTESGMNNHAIWGGQYFRWWLVQQPHYGNDRYTAGSINEIQKYKVRDSCQHLDEP